MLLLLKKIQWWIEKVFWADCTSLIECGRLSAGQRKHLLFTHSLNVSMSTLF